MTPEKVGNDETALPLSLDDFLASVEQRAYRIAKVALSDHDEALDVVQDTMIRLVNKYQERPSSEWRTLFFTILHNRITDSHRKNTLRQRLFGWFERAPDKEDGSSPLDRVSAQPGLQPQRQLASTHAMSQLEQAVHELPLRQQQVFMLRMVEEMDTKATAEVMGCSTGSVKTHLSRALAALQGKLEDHYEPVG